MSDWDVVCLLIACAMILLTFAVWGAAQQSKEQKKMDERTRQHAEDYAMRVLGPWKDRGFTIIELMIVVAIIGILAAIAIPQYQAYTVRAFVSEGIGLASAAETAVAEARQGNGVFPVSNPEAGWPGAGTSLIASVNVGDKGVITVTYSGDSRLQGAANGTLSFIPSDVTGSITWICSTSATLHPIPLQFLPANCRN